MAASARKKPELVTGTGPGSDDLFEYPTEHGTIILPPLGQVPIGIMRKARKSSGVNQLFDIIEALADPETLELFDKLNANQVAELNDAWAAHSGVGTGESSAS